MAGRFIVFEGPDGAGKSGLVEAARRRLASRGIPATFVADPGGTPIGRQIRQVLLSPENTAMCPMTELLLYVASRAQLVAEVVRPALVRGDVVVSDRFTLSTLAYQGASGSASDEDLARIVPLGLDGLTPDAILLLDLPSEVGLARVARAKDRMESKGLAYHLEVRRRYLAVAKTFPPGVVRIVDANRPREAVERDALEILDAVVG